MDAAKAHVARQFSQAETPRVSHDGTILVRNDTGDALPRFGVAAITEPIVDPDVSEREFCARVAVSVGLPSGGGDYVITTEPIPAGKYGRARIDGVSHAKVDMADASHMYAAAAEDEVAALASGASGSPILWVAPGLGEQWAIVRIGKAGSGGQQRVRFQITSKVDEGEYTAEIDAMDGSFIASATLRDPLKLFGDLPAGVRGYAEKDGNDYWITMPQCVAEVYVPEDDDEEEEP